MSESIMRDTSKVSMNFERATMPVMDLMEYILQGTQKFNPTLRNITTIEKLIYENKEFDSKTQLYKKLPTSMQYPTFNFILDILEKKNEIMFDKDGSFFWTGQANPKLNENLENAVEY